MSSNEPSLEELLKSKKISQVTFDKVTIAKEFIERKYNLKTLKNAEWNKIMDKIDSLNISQEQKDKLKQDLYEKEKQKYRKMREKLSIRDYESIAIIGRGAFGEVHVCREKETSEIVAIKKIKKEVLLQKNQVIHVRNEQQFLSKVKSPWTVDLRASFQEDDYLYLVMEFLPGGDLMNLLIKKDIFTEEEARFYTAELILSIESIHKLDCIHRDIKPDNILIDKTGHIKLSDFGLAKVSDKIFEKNKDNNFNDNSAPTHHKKNYSCVGTAYYVAPEVLNKKGYGPEIDWWSVGVIFFEMLVGYAPFCSKETSDVCMKILNWPKYLKIPEKTKISKEAEDLIKKMINNSNVRLGKNGAEEIKKHPFFKGIDWKNIRTTKAPFIPELTSDYDVRYFETFDVKEPFYPPIQKHKKRKDVEYIGYTYKGDDDENNTDDDIDSTMEIIKRLEKNEGGDNKEGTVIKTNSGEIKITSVVEPVPNSDKNSGNINNSIGNTKMNSNGISGHNANSGNNSNNNSNSINNKEHKSKEVSNGSDAKDSKDDDLESQKVQNSINSKSDNKKLSVVPKKKLTAKDDKKEDVKKEDVKKEEIKKDDKKEIPNSNQKKIQIIPIPLKKMKGEGVTKNNLSARNDKNDKNEKVVNNAGNNNNNNNSSSSNNNNNNNASIPVNNLAKKPTRLSPSPKRNIFPTVIAKAQNTVANKPAPVRTNKSPAVSKPVLPKKK